MNHTDEDICCSGPRQRLVCTIYRDSRIDKVLKPALACFPFCNGVCSDQSGDSVLALERYDPAQKKRRKVSVANGSWISRKKVAKVIIAKRARNPCSPQVRRITNEGIEPTTSHYLWEC